MGVIYEVDPQVKRTGISQKEPRQGQAFDFAILHLSKSPEPLRVRLNAE
jgi:hypothetical protein